MKLRAGIAAFAVLGLGGALASAHAEDAAPAVAAPQPQAVDASLPRFQPAVQPAQLVPVAPVAEEMSEAEPEESWEPVGRGVASWYGPKFAGRRTASGETFDPTEYTAAHRTLPFGSTVRVTSDSGRSVVVRINDRGPFSPGRVIDVSQAAARDLGLIGPGHGNVSLAILDE
ncbi:septal ring lytic transglycosylase RlpA family protein [Croceibacterium soli]|nr:septal ring lytic transglycosylase RlpA family protein [Croceibacterium soli]